MNVVSYESTLTTKPWSTSRAACVLLLAVGLSACGSSRSPGKNSQVVAVVNDKEITITQLNRVLRAAGPTEVTAALTQQALDSLTDEELLVQAALKHEIDRDPAYVQALEQTRRQLLAQFFAERTVYPKTVISAEEITDYYKREPLLFSNRRKFLFTTFLTEKSDMTPVIDAELDHVATVDQVRGILDRHAIKYVTQMASVTPEQVPLKQLSQFSSAKVGDLFINEQDGGKVLLMSVTSIDNDVPLTLDRARPMIESYLRNSRNKQATDEYLKHARAAAEISYHLPQDKAAPMQANASAPAGERSGVSGNYAPQTAGGAN